MLLAALTASFIYINTTSINSEQILALEPTADNKGCLVHLLTKNPFQVEGSCVDIQRKINEANARSGSKSGATNILLAGLTGLLIGGALGFFASRIKKPSA